MKISDKVVETKSKAFDAICDILAEGGELDVSTHGSSEMAVSKIQDIMCLVHTVDCTIDGITDTPDWREEIQ